MDAFKLLTRSTKLKPGPVSRQQAISNSLPSAGEAESPQLFSRRHGLDAAEAYHGQSESKGRKRKRGSDGNETSADSTAVTLDFFGSGSSALGFSGDAKTARLKQNEDDEQKGDAADGIATKEIPLSEEERKAILTAHKIKVTDLQTPPIVAEDEKKSKKRKKKQKDEQAPVVLSRKQQKKAQRMYPQPLVSFHQLRMRYQISRRLSENIFNQGYSVPTEVQLGALPLLLGDCQSSSIRSQENGAQLVQPALEPDLLVVAPTGSGKTLAFMIPLINKIMREHHQGESHLRELFAIILAPTKELVSQIVNEGRKLMVGTGVKITAMRKGMRLVEDMEGEEEAPSGEESGSSEDEHDGTRKVTLLKGKVPITKSDILVSTPLLLANSLSSNKKHATATLPTIRSLVLDEADVLLDPLFRDQTLDVWSACTNVQLRVGLWSATMGSSIEELAKSTIGERQQSLGLRSESFLVRLVVGLKDTAIPNISHKLVYAATEQGKLLGLRQLLHPKGRGSTSDTHLRPPFLVFTQTISRAVALHSELKYDIPTEAGGSSRIAVLHSELSDSQRSDVMAGFRKGEIWILITTDLLSRGVDFRGINGVVNYDIPSSSASYIHRVGRTGRAGREGGVAVTFYTKEDIPYVKNIANVIAASEKLMGVSEDKGIQKWLLDALPNLSKKDKKDLKRHGVSVRRPMTKKGEPDDKDRRRTRISTKSGFERRKEHNRRDAAKASKRRKHEGQADEGGNASDNGSWGGIED